MRRLLLNPVVATTIYATIMGTVLICPSMATDANDRFITGGGVGQVQCPDFLNAMSTARQRGGLASIDGINVMQGFMMYIAGFQTGYNSKAPGIYDIFALFGDKPIEKAMYSIEAWCGTNPDKKFVSGLLVLAYRLEAGIKGAK